MRGFATRDTGRSVSPRLVLFLVVAVLVAFIVWSARSAMIPFVIGLVLAYLLAPLVARLHRAMPQALRRRRLARPLAILTVYFVGVVLLVGAGMVFVPPVFRQAGELVQQAPTLTQDVIARINQQAGVYYWGTTPEVRQLVDQLVSSQAAQRLTSGLVDAMRSMALGAFGAVTGTVAWLLGLLVVPIWLVYILTDKDRVMAGAIGLVPSDIRPDVEAVRVICDRVLAAYIRGQIVVAAILGFNVTVALTLLRVPYSLLLGTVAAVLGVIPFLGSILGAVPAVAVGASQSLQLAVLVVLAFIVVQQIDNLFVSPRLQARAVALNPALIMIVLVIGQRLMGPLGMLVAVPLTAVLRDVVHYLYLRVGEDHPSPLDALTEVGYGESATPLVRGTTAAGGRGGSGAITPSGRDEWPPSPS